MNESPQQSVDKDSFALTLANGLEWRFVAVDEFVAPWVKKLAAVLNLPVSQTNGSPKFIFVHQDGGRGEGISRQPGMRTMDHAFRLPGPGWKEQYLGIIRFLRHPESRQHNLWCSWRASLGNSSHPNVDCVKSGI